MTRPIEKSAPIPQEEFVRLFVMNQRRIHAFIRTLVPNLADADDVLQETSITGLAKVAEGKLSFPIASEEFVTWICTVARYECLRYCRMHHGKRLVFGEQLTNELAGRQVDQLSYLEARHEALQRCLQKLSPRDLSIVRYRWVSNLSGKEIAQQLGRPTNTIYKAFQRIRNQLIECVDRVVRSESRL